MIEPLAASVVFFSGAVLTVANVAMLATVTFALMFSVEVLLPLIAPNTEPSASSPIVSVVFSLVTFSTDERFSDDSSTMPGIVASPPV